MWLRKVEGRTSGRVEKSIYAQAKEEASYLYQVDIVVVLFMVMAIIVAMLLVLHHLEAAHTFILWWRRWYHRSERSGWVEWTEPTP